MLSTHSAIIFRRRAINEYDLLLEMYIENIGRASVRARGALRHESKLRGHLEPGRLVRALFAGKYPRIGIGDVETLENFVSHDGGSWCEQGLFLAVCEAYLPWGSYNKELFDAIIESMYVIRDAKSAERIFALQVGLLEFSREFGISMKYHDGLTFQNLWKFLQYHAPRMIPDFHIDE